jgi:hypothetical protein
LTSLTTFAAVAQCGQRLAAILPLADGGIALGGPSPARAGGHSTERQRVMNDTGKKCFWADQDGAVTVDWVVLSAAVIGLGLAVLYPIAYSTDSATNVVADYIAAVPVGN